jgi:hypothetical protein
LLMRPACSPWVFLRLVLVCFCFGPSVFFPWLASSEIGWHGCQCSCSHLCPALLYSPAAFVNLSHFSWPSVKAMFCCVRDAVFVTRMPAGSCAVCALSQFVSTWLSRHILHTHLHTLLCDDHATQFFLPVCPPHTSLATEQCDATSCIREPPRVLEFLPSRDRVWCDVFLCGCWLTDNKLNKSLSLGMQCWLVGACACVCMWVGVCVCCADSPVREQGGAVLQHTRDVPLLLAACVPSGQDKASSSHFGRGTYVCARSTTLRSRSRCTLTRSCPASCTTPNLHTLRKTSPSTCGGYRALVFASTSCVGRVP